MAVYFALISKETKEAVNLAKVDDIMCEHFKVEPSKTRYYRNWHDTIGFWFAMGKTPEEIRENWEDRADILDYLLENYEVEYGGCR